MKKVSLKDIAKLAGVAPSTVSFVLNGKASQMRISDVLAEKILAIAKNAGYHPNQVAVSLRTGKSQILGLIVENISNSFFAKLAKTIEEEADKFGYKVLYCSTENDPRKGKELIRMLSQQQIGGYLITPGTGMKEDILELIKHNKPVVLMDRYFPDVNIPYVSVDNYEGVSTAIKHLVGKGYKKIGFVTIEMELIQMALRELAFEETLIAEGLSFQKSSVLKVQYNAEPEDSLQQIEAFIKENKFDAIFFSTNYLGILGLESIQRAGLKIPADIAVVSFDDHDIFRLYNPGITAVRQPIEDIAKTAIRLLMEQLNMADNSGTKKNQFQLAAKMVIRRST